MLNDEQLLSTIPDYMVFGTMLKATPATEGGERIIYVEASNEGRDIDGEIVLSKALKESADYFIKFGVVDLDHKSMPNVAQRMGLVAEEWAIGQPVDVRFDGDTTFVKAKLYDGDTPLAEKARNVWDGLTKLNPPARYYASVGGAVLGRDVRFDPKSGERIPVVTKTRWSNLALSQVPVNNHLATASSAPIGVFAKSLNAYVLKGLEAGYGTDSASLTGGAALRGQSLHGSPIGYMEFRDRLSAAIKRHPGGLGGARGISALATRQFGLSEDQATEWVGRFLRDLESEMKRRKQ
jgi:hypothetical protein